MDGLFLAPRKLRIPVSGPGPTRVPHSPTPVSAIAEVPDSVALHFDSYFRARLPSQMSSNPEDPRGNDPSAWQCLQNPPLRAHHTTKGVGKMGAQWTKPSGEEKHRHPHVLPMVPGTLMIGRTILTMGEINPTSREEGIILHPSLVKQPIMKLS